MMERESVGDIGMFFVFPFLTRLHVSCHMTIHPSPGSKEGAQRAATNAEWEKGHALCLMHTALVGE